MTSWHHTIGQSSVSGHSNEKNLEYNIFDLVSLTYDHRNLAEIHEGTHKLTDTWTDGKTGLILLPRLLAWEVNHVFELTEKLGWGSNCESQTIGLLDCCSPSISNSVL